MVAQTGSARPSARSGTEASTLAGSTRARAVGGRAGRGGDGDDDGEDADEEEKDDDSPDRAGCAAHECGAKRDGSAAANGVTKPASVVVVAVLTD
jgi:hypothetical protein